MAVRAKRNLRYNVFNPDQLEGLYPSPIISDSRAPTANDFSDIGTIWVDMSADNAYIITSIVDNAATWKALSDITTVGTNGQLWIGATGAAPTWANITSTGGSVTITNGANSINLEAAGVAALTSLDGDGGTATPLAGVITIAGGANITTTGAVHTLTVALDASPSVAGSLTAGVDLNMTSGDMTITADTDGAQTIYLHANGGTSETIDIHSDLGTGVASVYVHSDVGGLTFASGLASADAINITASDAAGGIDIDCGTAGVNIAAANGPIALISGTGAITIGTDAAAHTVTVGSTNTTSSTVIQSGTGDVIVTSTDAVTIDSAGALELNSSAGTIGIGNDAVAEDIDIGTGAAEKIITIGNATDATGVVINCGTGDVLVGANATAHNSTFGSTNTTSDTVIQSGTGGVSVVSGDAITIDSVGVLELNSSAGIIGIGNDAVAQNINIGTGAAARTITMGNNTTTTAIAITSGTGDITLTSEDDIVVDAGADVSIDADATVTIDAVGVLELNSSAGIISIGNDADAFAVNVGTGAAARDVTLGSTNTTSSTTVQSGTGDLILTSTDAVTIDAAGVLELNSSAGVIGIGNDAVAQDINIGTGAAARTITIGNGTTTTEVEIAGGTGGITLTPTGGAITMAPATGTVAGVTLTIDAYLGVATFTGQTTAAAATQVFTVTNALATTASQVFATASNLGANDAQMTLTRVEQKAGSIEFTLTNNGAASLNGNVVIAFWILG